MRISGVVTALNEAATIAEVIRAAKPFVDEVIVVDGHSTDGTAEIAAKEGARVVQDNRRGKGDATRVGIEAAKGEVLLIMTADGSDDYARCREVTEPVVKGQADLVIGSRFQGGSEEFSATLTQLIRTAGNISLNVLINWRWGTELTDVLNAFRAIRRDTAMSLGLNTDSAAIETEMVVKALKKGLRVVNVPTHEFARKVGDTRLTVWKEGLKIYWSVFRHLV
ncbi:MAG: glycosyltransferase [Elusimicrobia bacterium]|nr:glycosyltransferase [Elusimicrobiota bacterium]